jgi:hypothetical protein
MIDEDDDPDCSCVEDKTRRSVSAEANPAEQNAVQTGAYEGKGDGGRAVSTSRRKTTTAWSRTEIDSPRSASSRIDQTMPGRSERPSGGKQDRPLRDPFADHLPIKN